MKWTDEKAAIIAALKEIGYTDEKQNDVFQLIDPNNPMIPTVNLKSQPKSGEHIPVYFINTEDLEGEYLQDVNGQLGAAKQLIRNAKNKLEAEQKEAKPEPSKPQAKPEKQDIKPIKETPNVPATVSKAQPPAKNKYAVDPDTERKMEEKKTKEFLQGRGKSYAVSGKERPDAHAIQHAANATSLDTEILIAEQNDKQCKVVVRAHMGDRYIDAVVIHDFGVERQLKTMEMIKNRPEILDHFEGLIPVIKEDATVKMKTDKGWEEVPASYFMIHALLHQRRFAIRDATTKASAIAQSKMLNREDWRDPEEVEMEYEERNMVQNSIETGKAQRRA